MNNNTTFIANKRLSVDLSKVEGIKFNNTEKSIYLHMYSGKTLSWTKLTHEDFNKYRKFFIEYFNITDINILIDESK